MFRLAAMRRILSSWFGTGLILGKLRGSHLGSGTVAALFTFPIALWIGADFGWQTQVAGVVFVTLLGLWAVSPFVSEEGDAGWIVIDEAGGTFLAVIGLSLGPAAVAWVVFRIADIFKRRFPGVAQVERLPGPRGVMADDLVAGLYGLAAGHIVQTFI